MRVTALDGLRIGCVRYLNAQPLVYGYEGPIRFEHPSDLARDMAAGELDAALVPVFEALRGGPYLVADGVAIASDGPVFSVFLAHRVPLYKVQTVMLDPASLTSVHLIQVLLAEFHGLRPAYVAFAPAPEAQLLIGNQAIDFRARAEPGWELLDLGEEWKRCTGLPFVYAVWVLRPSLLNPVEVAEAFRVLKADGVAQVREIAAVQRDYSEELAYRYLTEHIRFDLGDREKAGLGRFAELLRAEGFLPEGGKGLRYV